MSHKRSDGKRSTFRNDPVPNRYEYLRHTGHFSDGADLLTDTDTSIEGGGQGGGGENYWLLQKPLMLSTFRPISASSSSRISPNPNNSDLPASSVSSNSQQPSPNFNFSPESLIPSSFIIPPPPSHDTGGVGIPASDRQILSPTLRNEILNSPRGTVVESVGGDTFNKGVLKPSEDQIKKDVQFVFENMGIQEKPEICSRPSSRPESRTVTFSEPPSSSA